MNIKKIRSVIEAIEGLTYSEYCVLDDLVRRMFESSQREISFTQKDITRAAMVLTHEYDPSTPVNDAPQQTRMF